MNNIIRINNTFDILKLNGADDNTYIEGYAAHFGEANLNNERVDAESFDTFFKWYQDGKLTPVMNYNHDSNMVIGGIDELKTDETGLWIKSHLNTRIPFVKDWLVPAIENGDLKSFSTEGFIQGGWDGIIELNDGTYYVREFMLSAVAIVPTPADWKSEFSIANYLQNKPAAKPSRWYLI